MACSLKQEILEALKHVRHDSVGDIVSAGWVEGLVEAAGDVTVTLSIPSVGGVSFESVREDAERAVQSVPGVAKTQVVLTAHVSRPSPPRSARSIDLPNVRSVVAVASGKGGVGKSTTAVNLALAFRDVGLRVALFDADIYGPSVPCLTGLRGHRLEGGENYLLPAKNLGLQIISIGFMVEEENPLVWRGPMVMGALEQLLRETRWEDVDVMVMDMPPGTGDTQLTISQKVHLAGAVIVSTPQDLALIDAKKGMNMFSKVNVPVLGLIENMSYHTCSKCGHREHIFDHGGARKAAEESGIDFLGEIPLALSIRQDAGFGTPTVASDPKGPHAAAYMDIARRLIDRLALQPSDAPSPRKKWLGLF